MTESNFIEFHQFLAETYLRKFETNRMYTAHHTSFYMFIPYPVPCIKTSNNLCAIIGRIHGAIVAVTGLSDLPVYSLYTTGDRRRDDRSDSRGDDCPVYPP